MEQACGCSSVRGGGELTSGVLVSVAGTPTRHLHDGVCLLRRSRHGSLDRRSKLAAAPQCEVEADSRCVLVSAAGTLTRHLQDVVCLCDGAASQA